MNSRQFVISNQEINDDGMCRREQNILKIRSDCIGADIFIDANVLLFSFFHLLAGFFFIGKSRQNE